MLPASRARGASQEPWPLTRVANTIVPSFRGGRHSPPLADARRVDDGVVRIVASRGVEAAAAGDESQRRDGRPPEDPTRRERRLRPTFETLDAKAEDAAIGAPDPDQVAAAQVAQPVEDGGAVGGIDVPGDHGRPQLAGLVPRLVPASVAPLLGGLHRSIWLEPEGDHGSRDADGWDVDVARPRSFPIHNVDEPAGGRARQVPRGRPLGSEGRGGKRTADRGLVRRRAAGDRDRDHRQGGGVAGNDERRRRPKPAATDLALRVRGTRRHDSRERRRSTRPPAVSRSASAPEPRSSAETAPPSAVPPPPA